MVDVCGQLGVRGERRGLRGGAGVDVLPVEVYRRDEAEAHVAVVGAGGRLAGRCSLWWSDTPMVEGRRVGAIGHYAAADAAVGGRLLAEACGRLRRAGCDLAVGPMDGNTWRSYRLVIDRGEEPAFFLEPDHPADWPGHFEAAGFELLATYRSSVCDDLRRGDGRLERVERDLAGAGVRVRPLAMDRLEEDLLAIHGVCLDAFDGAPLYQPIAFEVMRRQYEVLLGRIDPGLVLMAERGGEAVGFVFAVPDYCGAARGGAVDTVVVKTLAVRRDRRLSGLGGLLLGRCHDAARRRGMRRAIHALMHERNGAVVALSSRYARPIRRYGLFARGLR